jgi:hypothetical protein
MDEQVLRSLIKWPNVPHCFGWLALDRRGQWRMRDEFAQAHHLAGNAIQHQALNEFIARNYAHDTKGRYFFQNGPQRVFITLDKAPWVVRITPSASKPGLMTQCQTPFTPHGALSDELGNIYITGLVKQTVDENGIESMSQTHPTVDQFMQKDAYSIALLHDHDLGLFSDLAKLREEACSFGGSWIWDKEVLPLDPIHSEELCERFGFVKNPVA